MPFTTRGLARIMFYVFRAAGLPSNFYLALITAATVPTHATKELSQLTQIAAGNGYTDGGYALNLNATDFPFISDDDVGQLAELHIKPVTWTATDGPLPSSGSPAKYIVLTTGDATIANREIIWYEVLLTTQAILLGQNLTVSNMKLRLQGGGMYKSNQRVTVPITGSSLTGTATIAAVDPTKAILTLLGSGSNNNSDTSDDISGVRIKLTNATTVTATRGLTLTLAGTLEVEVQIVEHF